ncbi:MAG TPA: SDR family NAD(P)-dependent oxidoreductase [Candidatus Sulfotelmatobacter sp.]|nr:SDR family NAD(P)-dependent oxidoreductase [Candidatus Sulfotelmatobacter sp.]
MPVPLSLEGKVALISGGSRGIGAATVQLFHAAGAKVVFSYRNASEEAETLSKDCGGESACHAVRCDLSNSHAARGLVSEAVKHFGRIDILVANHGVWPADDVSIDQMTDDQWRSTLSVNLDGVFGLVKHGVAQMKSQPPGSEPAGHIVLISSTSGQRGEAFHCDYSATKGAIISMTKTLASELAPNRIYVNCVAPGWVDTPMSAATLADPKSGEEIRRTIPLGRPGKPEEIAAPVLFLCTKYAGFVTGEVFNVNGGAVLAG